MRAITEDKGLQPSELSEKYDKVGEWVSHPVYTDADWIEAVLQCNTRRGYWDWVAGQIETAEDDEERPSTNTACDECGTLLEDGKFVNTASGRVVCTVCLNASPYLV